MGVNNNVAQTKFDWHIILANFCVTASQSGIHLSPGNLRYEPSCLCCVFLKILEWMVELFADAGMNKLEAGFSVFNCCIFAVSAQPQILRINLLKAY